MSSDKYDGLAWEITLGVAGGILLASFISALLGAIALWLFSNGFRIELPTKAAAAPVVYSQHTTSSYATTPITVPAKSVEECKQLSNGLINEQFRRCRTTHQEMNTTDKKVRAWTRVQTLIQFSASPYFTIQ